ncbi:MAG: (2Fe-2S)-binding protein [Acidobacteria bacterium]|nr:(2Fe-2S)-binding protein [Acidobacteriota bacterium]
MSIDVETREACCKLPTVACPCPVCGKVGRRVTARTLDHHVPPDQRKSFGDDAAFCANATCEVVYCNRAGQVIKKGETALPVTVKDPGDDVYVCYCFEISRGMVRRDLLTLGRTEIPDQIRKGVQEGRCDCERQNPQGACCLGNLARIIREFSESSLG